MKSTALDISPSPGRRPWPRSRSLFGLDDVTLQVLMAADRSVLVVPEEEM